LEPDSYPEKSNCQFLVSAGFISLWCYNILWYITCIIIGVNPPIAIRSIVAAVFLAVCICFVIVTAFNYWPVYYSDFLPKLDTIIAQHEKEIELAVEIKKCKRTNILSLL
jgi:hypothetical protein